MLEAEGDNVVMMVESIYDLRWVTDARQWIQGTKDVSGMYALPCDSSRRRREITFGCGSVGHDPIATRCRIKQSNPPPFSILAAAPSEVVD